MNSEITAVEYKINKLPFSSYLYQYAVTVSATLLLASGAITIGWSSPTIPKLLAENSPIPITNEQSSWLASIVVIGATIAPFPAAFMMDRFGRKATLLLNAIPIFIGWSLMAYGNSIEILYASRILNGLSFGISFCVIPIYLSEIASHNIRGSLIVLTIVMAKFGILYAYAIAPYVSVRAMALLAMIPLFIFIVTFVWLPESPYHLIANRNDELAMKNLIRLRKSNQVYLEYQQIKDSIRKRADIFNNNVDDEEHRKTFSKYITIFIENRRAFSIIIGLAAAQQLCGNEAIIAYSNQLFLDINQNLDNNHISIVLAVIHFIMACISSIIIDRFERRSLLLVSIILSGFSNVIVGIYFVLERSNIIYSQQLSISWLPIVFIMIFIISYSIGLASIPYAILSEIFPKNIKAKASAVYSLTTGLFQFIIIKSYQIVSQNYGNDYVFCGFAIFCFIFSIFIYRYVPETKGKPLEVILIEFKTNVK